MFAEDGALQNNLPSIGGNMALATAYRNGSLYSLLADSDWSNFSFAKSDLSGNIQASTSLSGLSFGLAVDSQDNFYYYDNTTGVIKKHDANLNHLADIGSSGTGDGQFVAGIGSSPLNYRLAIDSQDNFYVLDTYDDPDTEQYVTRIQKLDPTGQFIGKWESVVSEGSDYNAMSLVLSPDGGMYLGYEQQNNGYIRKLNADLQLDAAALYDLGDPYEGGEGMHPFAVAAGSNGRIYVGGYSDAMDIKILCDHSLSLNNCALNEDEYGNPIPTIPEALNVIPNKGDGKAIAMKAPSGSVLTSLVATPASDVPVDNADVTNTYPLGLVSFMLTGIEPGATLNNEVFFQTDLRPKDVTPRKYNPTTQTYSDIPNVTVTQTTVNNMTGLMVGYPLTDGGPLDLDGIANGSITDPIGLAVEQQGLLANTGLLLTLTGAIGLLLIATAVYTYLDYRKHITPLLAMDPHARYTYTYWHHLRVVTIPMWRYRVTIRVDRQKNMPARL
jgi:hypothetical protein